jgi:hypothetical protein
MNKSKDFVKEIEDKIAKVGWIYVFSQLTTALDEAIANIGSTVHVDCPFPDQHNSSGGRNKFRLFETFDTTGNAICTCNCQRARVGFNLLLDLNVAPNFSSLLGKLKKLLHDENVDKVNYLRPLALSKTLTGYNSPRNIQWRKDCLNSVAKELLPFDSPHAFPARMYFEKRGIPLMETTRAIGFHKNLDYTFYDRDKNKHTLQFPALVFKLNHPSGKPATLHRIYTSIEGFKAPTPEGRPVKKLMGSPIKGDLPGAAIRLYDKPAATLNITEGSEVGMAVRSIYDESIWAACSSSLLKSVEVPKERFNHVRIWADLDPLSSDGKIGGAGIKAAIVLEEKLLSQGFTVEILLPNCVLEADAEKGVDWEDVIVEHKLWDTPADQMDNAIAALSAPVSTVDKLRDLLIPLLFKNKKEDFKIAI